MNQQGANLLSMQSCDTLHEKVIDVQSFSLLRAADFRLLTSPFFILLCAQVLDKSGV